MYLVKFNKDTHFDRIKASYFDEKQVLSKYEQNLKKRWRHAFSLLLNMYSTQQVAKALTEEFGVSMSTAYRDVKNATVLFGDINDVDARGVRVILREAYWRLYQQALKERDLEQQRKALDSYRELFEFEIDENAIDPNKINAHEYHLKIPREIRKLLKKMIGKGVVDFNKWDTEDVSYEDLSDEEDS